MIGRFVFDIYAVSRIIIRWVCKKIEKRSIEIYEEKIKDCLEEYLDFIATLEENETAKTMIRIDRAALSVARIMQYSDGSYMWENSFAEGVPSTIMKLEYESTKPNHEIGFAILTETSKGRTNSIYLEPNYKQDFLYKNNVN